MVGGSRGGEASICTCMNVYNYLKLRDYQEVGITRLRNALTNHKHVIFSACVSYGKTVIMSFMAKGAVEKEIPSVEEVIKEEE